MTWNFWHAPSCYGLLLAVAACGGVAVIDPPGADSGEGGASSGEGGASSGEGGASSGEGGSGEGGDGMCCTDASQCPQPVLGCKVASCDDCTCQLVNAPEGAACEGGLCDANGECGISIEATCIQICSLLEQCQGLPPGSGCSDNCVATLAFCSDAEVEQLLGCNGWLQMGCGVDEFFACIELIPCLA